MKRASVLACAAALLAAGCSGATGAAQPAANAYPFAATPSGETCLSRGVRCDMQSIIVQTPRLKVHVVLHGDPSGDPIVFLHGNFSSWGVWRPVLEKLPDRYLAVALDMRGFGDTEPVPVDATRGMRDLSDDLWSLLGALHLDAKPVHVVGWSAGGPVALRFLLDHPAAISSLVLVAPISPYGLSGTKDEIGTPCFADYAGSGGGVVVPEFMQRLAAGDTSSDSAFSPRNRMKHGYFTPGYKIPPDLEEFLLREMLKTRIGVDFTPGSFVYSMNWPGVAPGDRGLLNAESPKYLNVSGIAAVTPRPRILWIRGSEDPVVADASPIDIGELGSEGVVPGWPGDAVFPPQPQVSQTRAVLRRYRDAGGWYEEVVVPDAGHAVFLQKTDEFVALLEQFLATGQATQPSLVDTR